MVSKLVAYCRRKSPWLLRISCSGCNGCNIEISACLTPRYDVERFGSILKGSARQGDILLVTGIVNDQIKDRLKQIYEQIPEPKVVVAIGSCSISKGIFYDSYCNSGPLDKVLPVDVYIPGCPPKPEAIIDGILKASKIFAQKVK